MLRVSLFSEYDYRKIFFVNFSFLLGFDNRKQIFTIVKLSKKITVVKLSKQIYVTETLRNKFTAEYLFVRTYVRSICYSFVKALYIFPFSFSCIHFMV